MPGASSSTSISAAPSPAMKMPFSHAQFPELIEWCCSNGWLVGENVSSHREEVTAVGLGVSSCSRLQTSWRRRRKRLDHSRCQKLTRLHSNSGRSNRAPAKYQLRRL